MLKHNPFLKNLWFGDSETGIQELKNGSLHVICGSI